MKRVRWACTISQAQHGVCVVPSWTRFVEGMAHRKSTTFTPRDNESWRANARIALMVSDDERWGKAK